MTAQSMLNEDEAKTTSTACGTACGASDDEKETSSACGTACGAGE